MIADKSFPLSSPTSSFFSTNNEFIAFCLQRHEIKLKFFFFPHSRCTLLWHLLKVEFGNYLETNLQCFPKSPTVLREFPRSSQFIFYPSWKPHQNFISDFLLLFLAGIEFFPLISSLTKKVDLFLQKILRLHWKNGAEKVFGQKFSSSFNQIGFTMIFLANKRFFCGIRCWLEYDAFICGKNLWWDLKSWKVCFKKTYWIFNSFVRKFFS